MNQDALDALRKFGADQMLEPSERQALEAVQITVSDQPLRIDLRFNYRSYVIGSTWVEIDGKWTKQC